MEGWMGGRNVKEGMDGRDECDGRGEGMDGCMGDNGWEGGT